jgi:exosome complex component RRP41
MSRRVEYFDAAGLRKDGRRALELREMNYIIGSGNKKTIPSATSSFQNNNNNSNDDDQNEDDDVNQESKSKNNNNNLGGGSSSSSSNMITTSGGSSADGFAELISPTTHVRALVFGPRQAQFRDAKQDSAHITCEVTALRRRGGGAARRARSNELASLVLEALQPVLLLSLYPLSSIHIHVDVLQCDGDEEVCCINAASLALADACIAMKDLVVATQVCFLDGKHVVVDPSYEELRSGCPKWIEAVFAHNPKLIAMIHEEGRYRADQEEEAKDSLHQACYGAVSAASKKIMDSLREHTNIQLSVLEGA